MTNLQTELRDMRRTLLDRKAEISDWIGSKLERCWLNVCLGLPVLIRRWYFIVPGYHTSRIRHLEAGDGSGLDERECRGPDIDRLPN